MKIANDSVVLDRVITHGPSFLIQALKHCAPQLEQQSYDKAKNSTKDHEAYL